MATLKTKPGKAVYVVIKKKNGEDLGGWGFTYEKAPGKTLGGLAVETLQGLLGKKVQGTPEELFLLEGYNPKPSQAVAKLRLKKEV